MYWTVHTGIFYMKVRSSMHVECFWFLFELNGARFLFLAACYFVRIFCCCFFFCRNGRGVWLTTQNN